MSIQLFACHKCGGQVVMTDEQIDAAERENIFAKSIRSGGGSFECRFCLMEARLKRLEQSFGISVGYNVKRSEIGPDGVRRIMDADLQIASIDQIEKPNPYGHHEGAEWSAKIGDELTIEISPEHWDSLQAAAKSANNLLGGIHFCIEGKTIGGRMIGFKERPTVLIKITSVESGTK